MAPDCRSDVPCEQREFDPLALLQIRKESMEQDELLSFILDVLKVTGEADMCSDIWWRTDGEYAPVTFFVNCNDLFYWATADLEHLTPENIGELKKAIEDASKTKPDDKMWADTLFCCRMRKMRPQGAFYKYIPEELWPLFDACGEERDTDREGFGNPTPHPKAAAILASKAELVYPEKSWLQKLKELWK